VIGVIALRGLLLVEAVVRKSDFGEPDYGRSTLLEGVMVRIFDCMDGKAGCAKLGGRIRAFCVMISTFHDIHDYHTPLGSAWAWDGWKSWEGCRYAVDTCELVYRDNIRLIGMVWSYMSLPSVN
jgi:hypothetical protein